MKKTHIIVLSLITAYVYFKLQGKKARKKVASGAVGSGVGIVQDLDIDNLPLGIGTAKNDNTGFVPPNVVNPIYDLPTSKIPGLVTARDYPTKPAIYSILSNSQKPASYNRLISAPVSRKITKPNSIYVI